MSWVCPDASLVVRLVVPGPGSEEAAELWATWRDSGVEPVAPSLLFFEVTNALRRYVAAGHLTPVEGQAALGVALDLGIGLVGDRALHQKALEVAEGLGLAAAHDAHYLALAERLDAELWTGDRRLAERVGTLGRVRLLGSGQG